jgi:pentapeptide MXKDX repeat protein
MNRSIVMTIKQNIIVLPALTLLAAISFTPVSFAQDAMKTDTMKSDTMKKDSMGMFSSVTEDAQTCMDALNFSNASIQQFRLFVHFQMTSPTRFISAAAENGTQSLGDTECQCVLLQYDRSRKGPVRPSRALIWKSKVVCACTGWFFANTPMAPELLRVRSLEVGASLPFFLTWLSAPV